MHSLKNRSARGGTDTRRATYDSSEEDARAQQLLWHGSAPHVAHGRSEAAHTSAWHDSATPAMVRMQHTRGWPRNEQISPARTAHPQRAVSASPRPHAVQHKAAQPPSAHDPVSVAGSPDDRSALQVVAGSTRRALRDASAAMRRNRTQALITLLLTSLCCASVALSVLAYLAVRAMRAAADSAAASGLRWPPGTTPADVAPDRDPSTLLGPGYSTAGGTSAFRIGFGSKYQASAPGADAIWQTSVLPARLDAWIWTGNMAFFDRALANCSASANAGAQGCQCGAAPLPPCASASADKAAAQARALLHSGYGKLLDSMCGQFFSAYGAVPPGSVASVCTQPVLGVYGVHDSFGVLSDRNHAAKWQLRQTYADLIGDTAAALRSSSLRGMFGRHRIFDDVAKGHSVDVYLLDEHFNRAQVPCGAVAAACAEHPNTVCAQSVCPLGAHYAMFVMLVCELAGCVTPHSIRGHRDELASGSVCLACCSCSLQQSFSTTAC